jgi:hypothetical protein
VAEVTELLPSKCEALKSNPSSAKKKKKKEKKELTEQREHWKERNLGLIDKMLTFKIAKMDVGMEVAW